MSKLLLFIGSLLIILSLCTCRTARQGSQEAPENAVSSLDSTTTTSSCEDFWQYVQQNWEYDSVLNAYLLSDDGKKTIIKDSFNGAQFLWMFKKMDTCLFNMSPNEIISMLGKPTSQAYDQPAEYMRYEYKMMLTPEPQYGKECYIHIHGRDSITKVIVGSREIFLL
jgi:hypothetical protein